MFFPCRNVPAEDQGALVRSMATIMGIPVDPDFDIENAIEFFDTQIELLRSPLWHDTISKFEPIRGSLFKNAGASDSATSVRAAAPAATAAAPAVAPAAPAVSTAGQQAPDVVIKGQVDSADRLEYFNNLLK